jgi:acyl dehydratase
VSARDVDLFSDRTGNRNPLHYDAALAAHSLFGGTIVQGGVTSRLLNAVVAEELPGPGTVFLGVEWRFAKALGVGRWAVGGGPWGGDHRPRRDHSRPRW